MLVRRAHPTDKEGGGVANATLAGGGTSGARVYLRGRLLCTTADAAQAAALAASTGHGAGVMSLQVRGTLTTL